jgi:hypothetical protein
MAQLSRTSFAILSVVACSYLFADTSYCQDSLLPPSHLIALSNYSHQVPLYWFAPGSQPIELGYDDGTYERPGYVGSEWKQNQAALKLNLNGYLPCYLELLKVYLVNLDNSPLEGNQNSPFQLSLHRDSSGVPGRILWGPILLKADSLAWDVKGQWLPVPVDLFINQDSLIWLVFHWLEQTPDAPLIGLNTTSSDFHSYFAQFNGEILDWTIYNDANLMFRAEILTNSVPTLQSLQLDSFNLYRTTNPGGTFSEGDKWLSLPAGSSQHMDSSLSNGQTYFYAISSVDSGQESPLQISDAALPRQGAQLQLSQMSKSIEMLPDSLILDSIQVTNSGDLPAQLRIQVQILDSLDHQVSDNWGHTWKSSQFSLDSHFNWIDIQQNEYLIAQGFADHASWGPYLLGFSFPFYGYAFDSFRIYSKGFISFTCPNSEFKNTVLPSSVGRFNLLAPFWDDLLPADSSKIYFKTNSESTVVSFVDLSRHPSGGNFSFQVILTPDGAIVFQYLKMSGTTNFATVGIQNHNGSDGLQIAYNEEYLTDSMIIQIPPPWLTINSLPTQLGAGDAGYLVFEVNAEDLKLGQYKGKLVLSAEDSTGFITPMGIPVILSVDTLTGIEDPELAQLPAQFRLYQNYPNPFNQSTRIGYTLKISGPVSLKVFNLLGEEVATLVNAIQSAGSYQVTWDGRNNRGEAVASGIYFYQLSLGNATQTRKLTLLK